MRIDLHLLILEPEISRRMFLYNFIFSLHEDLSILQHSAQLINYLGFARTRSERCLARTRCYGKMRMPKHSGGLLDDVID